MGLDASVEFVESDSRSTLASRSSPFAGKSKKKKIAPILQAT